jgi:hypothetical protein
MQKVKNVWDFEVNELLSWNVIMERYKLKTYKICELFEMVANLKTKRGMVSRQGEMQS